MIIRSRSPVRISFAGGGTDIAPYCNEKGGCVVSASINQHAFATLVGRDDKEIHIESADFLRNLRFGKTDQLTYNNDLDLFKAVIRQMNTINRGFNLFMRSDVQPKSGLGSSAAAFAAAIGVFNHLRKERKMTHYEVAELAYKLEREELKIAGGKQDQYATVFGGLNFIEFGDTWVRVNPLRMKKDHVLELEKHLILVFIGERTVEGGVIEDEKRGYMEKNPDVIAALDKTKEIAQEVRYALLKGDLYRFGELMHEAWLMKQKHSPLIATPAINDVYDFARKNGALGGKVTGAGGGGFMIFFCEPNKEHIVKQRLEEKGLRPMPIMFDFDGLQTWEVEDL